MKKIRGGGDTQRQHDGQKSYWQTHPRAHALHAYLYLFTPFAGVQAQRDTFKCTHAQNKTQKVSHSFIRHHVSVDIAAHKCTHALAGQFSRPTIALEQCAISSPQLFHSRCITPSHPIC